MLYKRTCHPAMNSDTEPKTGLIGSVLIFWSPPSDVIRNPLNPKMPRGTLEVLLVSAKGLEDTDFLSNMDPYAILTCRTQEKKSTVASGKGSDPEWNETFLFTISEGVSELKIKIMDKDTLTDDDFVGEATIPLDAAIAEGSVPPTSYNVVKDQEYCGEIRVGLNFTPEVSSDEGYGQEESFGGWRQSSRDY